MCEQVVDGEKKLNKNRSEYKNKIVKLTSLGDAEEAADAVVVAVAAVAVVAAGAGVGASCRGAGADLWWCW